MLIRLRCRQTKHGINHTISFGVVIVSQLAAARRCCGRASPRRKDKDLAWINHVGIADLLPVRLVNDGVARARAVGETTYAPEAVHAGYDGGSDIRPYTS